MSKIWLVGCGQIAIEYAKILNELGESFTVFGRGLKSSQKFTELTGKEVILQSIVSYKEDKAPEYLIIAVSIENLASITIEAIGLGIKNILVEKPLALSSSEVECIYDISKKNNCNVFIGFNRRFFSSTMEAINIIKADGGVKSIHFEFTEWPNVFLDPKNSKEAKEKWILCNSSHVIDLAFYLAGKPEEMVSFVSGGTVHHPSGSVFCGSGLTQRGALFSYHANWESSGRWSIEVMTNKRRLILCPMEQLKTQEISSIQQNRIIIDDSLDKKFKPGLFLEVDNFLKKNQSNLYTIGMLVDSMSIYNKIGGYDAKEE